MIGNERAIKLLNCSKNSPTHILKGPKGLGKATIAKSLANHYLCSTHENNCDCLSCRKFRSGNHPDYIYIGVNEEETSIKVEKILPIIQESLSAPLESTYKVIVIDDADVMTVEAQNKLLKTVEDIPTYMKMIFVAHKPLLPTIESRCINHYFNPLNDELMKKFVDELDLDEFSKEILLALSDGSPGIAMKLKDSSIISYFSTCINLILNKGSAQELLTAHGLLKEKDKDSIITVLNNDMVFYLKGLYRLFYDLLSCDLGVNYYCFKSKATEIKAAGGFYDKVKIIDIIKYLDSLLINNKIISDVALIKLFDLIIN